MVSLFNVIPNFLGYLMPELSLENKTKCTIKPKLYYSKSKHLSASENQSR